MRELNTVIAARVTPRERHILEAAARAEGSTVSAYLRASAVYAARESLKDLARTGAGINDDDK